MAFKLDDLIIDRIQYGVATDFSDNPLYVLTQLSDATISTSAESTDAVDAQGTLIKRFWRAKSGELTATNAMINLSIIGASSGSGKQNASETAPIIMPKIMKVVGSTASVTLDDIDADSVDAITVAGIGKNGAMITAFTKGASATTTAFAYDTTSKKLTLPTLATEDQSSMSFLIKYYRDVTAGVVIHNKADKFPQTVRLTLKALAVDPCSADTLRACYIVIHSFQVSPEIEISLTTDGTLDYSGAMQVDYCSDDKSLYSVYWAEDDEEDED